MIDTLHHYRLLRLTLEADSAHAIHSGRGDTTHDVLLVRDANGLPTLPGSSLAGVLRQRYRERGGEEACERLFGSDGNGGTPSRLQVSWGLIHDSQNRPLEGLVETVQSDPLLAQLADSKPLVRQRVRLNSLGSAAAEGKFDTTLVPAGVRYTCLLGYWSDDSAESQQDWQALIDLLRAPQLRLGHGTRTGAGLFRAINLHEGAWDLTRADGAEGYRNRPRTRTETRGLTALPVSGGSHDTLNVTLSLQAEGGWRIGGGERPLDGTLKPGEKEPDLLPMHEYRIHWQGDQASIGRQQHLLPASAIKGALRHRLAFHYRRLTGEFADTSVDSDAAACEAVRVLFGHADSDSARAWLIHIDDLRLDNTRTTVLMHNRIDRFTGGVMRGALFGEQVLWDTPANLTLHLTGGNQLEGISPSIRQALQLTLEDLARGWLPLGAAGGRGLGVFTTSAGPQWSDGGQWIGTTSATQEQPA